MTEVAAAATKSNGAASSGTAVSGVAPQPSSGNSMTAWPEYMVDAFQRSVLFLDLLRQRGNEEIEITSRPMATVLRFDHEVADERPVAAAADQLCALAHRAAARAS